MAAAAAPAAASDLPPRTYYFNCASPAKVQNANGFGVTAPTGGRIGPFTPSWSLLRPTGTMQSGAGCGYADGPLAGTSPGSLYDATYGGVHDEPVARVDVELHDLPAGRARAGATKAIIARLAVGGVELVRRPLTLTPAAGASSATEVARFTLDGLSIPGGTKNRQILLTIDTTSGASSWVHGASDAPASLTFTPPVHP